MYRIITISREFASGGRTIGKKVADALGYAYYDNELVTKIAKESGFAEAFVKENGEYAGFTSSLLFNLSLNNIGAAGTLSTSDQLYTYQHKIIRELAEKGNCVIVGRCADYILEDIPNHLNVFVYAPEEARLKNCVENLQMDPQTAKKMMRDVDAARNRYHKAYIPGWQSVFDHKDLMIDSSRFGIDGTAKILADIVRNQWG